MVGVKGDRHGISPHQLILMLVQFFFVLFLSSCIKKHTIPKRHGVEPQFLQLLMVTSCFDSLMLLCLPRGVVIQGCIAARGVNDWRWSEEQKREDRASGGILEVISSMNNDEELR